MTSAPAYAAPRPVSARSAMLTALLAAGDVPLTVRDLVAVAALAEVSESTARVAVSRMVAAGDIVREGDGVQLGARLAERKVRQAELIDPATHAWDGSWELLVLTTTGRSHTERADRRALLASLRLAELREGVWTRPANLSRALPADATALGELLHAVPESDAVALAGRLWPLAEWADHARELLSAVQSSRSTSDRFATCVASVRHLMTDPALPPELVGDDWPAAALRTSYAAAREWLLSVRG